MKLSDPLCLYPDTRGLRKAVRYKVEDMPTHEAADIALLGGRWSYFRVSHGVSGHWMGKFQTAIDALRDLESTFPPNEAKTHEQRDVDELERLLRLEDPRK